MVNQEVDQKTTPVSEPELVASIIANAKQMFNVELSRPQVAILISHINLETGSSGAGWQGGGVGNTSMHNYNLGNIQWTSGSGKDYFVGGDRTKDANGKWKGTHYNFLAFPTLDAGVKYYLGFIHNSGGGKTWQTVLQGDPSAFSQALKHTGYYEEDEEKYENAMKSRLNTFNKGKSYDTALSGSAPQSPEDLLAQYLAALSSTNNRSMKKKAIKQLLPNDYLLKIQAEYSDGIEFARILSAAIDEELYEEASIYTNGYKVQLQTTIHGPAQLCTQALLELSNAIANNFVVPVKIIVCQNKQPNFPALDVATASQQYDLFHRRTYGQ
jgi:hypothetical protein